MKKILILATFIYLFIAPFTHHPDNKLVLYWAGLEHGQVWNIWEYGQKNFPTESQFNYPPFHFYLDKLQFAVASVLGGPGFYEWLGTPNSDDPYQPRLAQYALAVKFGLIVFGLLVGYLLYKIAKQHGASETQARLAAGLWLFNPIVIYSIPMMGQNDVMAVLFFLLGWLLLKRSQVGALILFGLAASIKMYPLLWLPFLLLPHPQLTIKEKLKVLIGSVGVYVLTLVPFLSNSVFREAVLNSDINKRFFIGQIDLGFSDALVVVPLLLALAVFATTKLAAASQQKNETTTLTQQSFAIMSSSLILLGFSHFHPQWFTWIVPFWALWLVFQKKQTFWLAAIISFLTFGAWLLIVLLFQDSYLSFGLFVPINQTLANLPSLHALLTERGIDTTQLNNFAHTWLAAVGALALIQLFQWKETEAEKKAPFELKFGWPFPKWMTAILITLVSLGLVLAITSVTYLIPAPRSSANPNITAYEEILQPFQTTVTAQYDNFSRIELFFKNPGLANDDTFEVLISDDQNNQLVRQTFSGFNTGDPSSLRFDFMPQTQSTNHQYQLVVSPVGSESATTSIPLRIGLTDPDVNTLATKTYYAAPQGVKQAFQQSVSTVIAILRSIPWLFGILVLILFVL